MLHGSIAEFPEAFGKESCTSDRMAVDSALKHAKMYVNLSDQKPRMYR